MPQGRLFLPSVFHNLFKVSCAGQVMKAVILAAGKGTRINTGSVLVPKPLYTVGRKALIEHTILNLKQGGIKEFVIIIGFMSEHIKDFLNDGSELGVSIKYVYNPLFERELGVSALAAQKAVPAENFILTMADHVIDPEIVRELILDKGNSDKCVLCVDRKLDQVNDLEDATKVLEENEYIVNIDKKLQEFNCIDCGLFLMTPKIFSALNATTSQGKDTLSDGVQELIKTKDFIVHNIGDKVWTEVDTRSDLMLCEELIEQMNWRNDAG